MKEDILNSPLLGDQLALGCGGNFHLILYVITRY